MQIFIVIEGRQSGNFNHSCGKVLAAGTNEMCIVKVDAFPEPVTAVKFKIHDEDGNELGESSSFSIKAAGSSDTGGANWALYGGIFGGVLVLIALVVGLLMFMGREGDEGDDFFVEDEDYLPPGQAVQPISRGPARAESTDSGDYGGRSSGPPGYSAGPPGGSESKMDRAKRLFPFWDDATIQNYFDQGWSIQQLQDWVKENK
jgi:hypothetical protein